MSFLVDANGELIQGTFADGPYGAEDMTMACWAKLSDYPAATRGVMVNFGSDFLSQNHSLFIQAPEVSDRIAAATRSTGISGATYDSGAAEYDDIWVPIVGTYVTTTNRNVYVELFSNSGQDTTSINANNTLDSVSIGNQVDDGQPLLGLISHVAIWDSVLIQSEIEAFMAATSQADIEAIDSANLLCYWPLTADSSTHTNLGTGTMSSVMTVTNATHSSDDPFITITSVSGDDAWTDGDTGIPIVGTGFV
jgi:hypothetical protein